MASQLFFDFALGVNNEYNQITQNSNESIQYLVYSNADKVKFFTSEIAELGPRPASFPSKSPINRIDEELKLIFILLDQINTSDIIFGEKRKLKYLYYRSKRFGIREGYISRKVRLMKVKSLKIPHNSFNNKIKKLYNDLKKLKQRSDNHWDVLHLLYLKVKLNSLLISNNGFRNKKGIFEIKINKPKKKDLLEYFYGM